MGRKAVLTDEQRKENKRLANLNYRSKPENKNKARVASQNFHNANKTRRNARKRELYALRKAQRVRVVVNPNDKIISV